MRYQLVADNPAEENAISSHPTVRALFDPFLPVIQARAIMAAVRLGIFEDLGAEARTIDQLAVDLSLDADTLGLLLPVLECAGYVCGEGKNYRLTEPARELARQEGIDDVVAHRVGDVLTEDLGHRIFDAAFLGNIIHHFTEDQNRDLFQRIKMALKTDGAAKFGRVMAWPCFSGSRRPRGVTQRMN